jgi:hypothetical protein
MARQHDARVVARVRHSAIVGDVDEPIPHRRTPLANLLRSHFVPLEIIDVVDDELWFGLIHA